MRLADIVEGKGKLVFQPFSRGKVGGWGGATPTGTVETRDSQSVASALRVALAASNGDPILDHDRHAADPLLAYLNVKSNTAIARDYRMLNCQEENGIVTLVPMWHEGSRGAYGHHPELGVSLSLTSPDLGQAILDQLKKCTWLPGRIGIELGQTGTTPPTR